MRHEARRQESSLEEAVRGYKLQFEPCGSRRDRNQAPDAAMLHHSLPPFARYSRARKAVVTWHVVQKEEAMDAANDPAAQVSQACVPELFL